MTERSSPDIESQMKRTLSQYDNTIDRAKDDQALSDTGRAAIIEHE